MPPMTPNIPNITVITIIAKLTDIISLVLEDITSAELLSIRPIVTTRCHIPKTANNIETLTPNRVLSTSAIVMDLNRLIRRQ